METTSIDIIPDSVSKELASFGADRTKLSIDKERENLIDTKKEDNQAFC